MTDQDRTNGRGAEGEDQRMTASLIQAINHPFRRQLLRVLHSSDGAHSPIQLSKMLGEEVSRVSYHVKILVALGAAKKMSDRQVRGARENFFASKVSGHKQMVAILADTERDDAGVRA